MKKYFIVLLLFAGVVCAEEEPSAFSQFMFGDKKDPRLSFKQSLELKSADFYTLCLGGVAYWYRSQVHNTWFAPKIDPETLQPMRCDGDGIIDRID